MEKFKLSLFQLYVVMVLFGLGGSSVLGLGVQIAKQDAWMSVIIASIGGMILLVMYGYIFKNHKNTPYTLTLEKILGKMLGKIVALLYIMYFMLIASLVLRDIGELIATYVLVGTPIIVVHLLTLSVTIYAVYLGIETISRCGEIDYLVVAGLFILFFIFLGFTGCIKLENLTPMLEDGIKPVIQAAVPLMLAFPFGEMLVFLMIFQYANKKKHVIKIGLLSITTTMFLLTLLTIMNITTIGVYLTSNSFFPTIETIRMINVGDFIQRIDSVAVIIFMIGGFFKLTIYHFASSLALQGVFNTKKYNKFIVPVGIVILAGSLLIADNLTKHLYFGLRIVTRYVNVSFEVIIPVILLTVVFIKTKVFKMKPN